MSVKTQALDRLLEAIAPALAAELETVIQENRSSLEEEFQGRLQAAVRDAESAAASMARGELDQTIEQAKEEARRQLTAELEPQFKERLDAEIAKVRTETAGEYEKLQASLIEQRGEWSTELGKVEDNVQLWRTLAQAQHQFDEASSQSEILSRFFKLAQPYAEGLGLYVSKPDGLALWKSRGKGPFPEIIATESRDPESYFRALSVRGKTVVAICATPAFNVEALDYLAGALGRAIEFFGLKLRAPASKPETK
jgi:hypothetical protein